jgi:hypothetical protein
MPLSQITSKSFASTINLSSKSVVTTNTVFIGTSNTTPVADESLILRNSGGHQLSLRCDNTGAQAQIIFQGNINRYQLGVGNSGMPSQANNMYIYNATTATFPWVMQSDAYIKTPYQPGCKVRIDAGSGTFPSGAGGAVALTSSYATFTKTGARDAFDRTNSFDTTTGRFTAPVSGMYFIGCNWMRNNALGSGATLRFAKNGTTSNMFARYYRPGNSWSYETSSLTTITTLTVGDYVNIINTDPYSTSFYDDDSYFFAYFLG